MERGFVECHLDKVRSGFGSGFGLGLNPNPKKPKPKPNSNPSPNPSPNARQEELGMGMQSYTLSIGLHDGHEALALTAAKRVTNGNTQYQLYLP